MLPLIDLEHVSVRRDGNLILDDVSLAVNRHQPLAILGANGSGKSTLIRLMTREIYPLSDGGKVRWWGRERWEQAELRKHVAVVQPINPSALLADFSVHAMVITGAIGTIGVTEFDSISADDHAAATAFLDHFKVGHLAERSYASLSAGETQRALLARALMTKPRVLILDEPTNGLDFVARHQLLADLERLPDTVEGLILVTHHFAEITEMYSQVVLMHQGRILVQGTREEILRPDLVAEAFDCSRQLASQELPPRISA